MNTPLFQEGAPWALLGPGADLVISVMTANTACVCPQSRWLLCQAGLWSPSPDRLTKRSSGKQKRHPKSKSGRVSTRSQKQINVVSDADDESLGMCVYVCVMMHDCCVCGMMYVCMSMWGVLCGRCGGVSVVWYVCCVVCGVCV